MARFRFPRFAVGLMLMAFITTVFAIEMGRNVSTGIPAEVTTMWSVLPPLIALVSVPLIAAAVAYAIRLVRNVME
jgi:hypothetical protein